MRTKIRRPFMVTKITLVADSLPMYELSPSTEVDHPGGPVPDDVESDEFKEWCAAVNAANKEHLALAKIVDTEYGGVDLLLDMDLDVGDKLMLTLEVL